MKLYIAATFEAKDAMRIFADKLTAQGYEITASWLYRDEPMSPGNLPVPGACIPYAQRDLQDIDASDALLLFSGPSPRGGKWVEFGYALAKGKQLFVCGPQSNIFTPLAQEWAGPLPEAE